MVIQKDVLVMTPESHLIAEWLWETERDRVRVEVLPMLDPDDPDSLGRLEDLAIDLLAAEHCDYYPGNGDIISNMLDVVFHQICWPEVATYLLTRFGTES